ncbi:MAG: hypothetical protein HY763_08320 [Planctomycetes bacterium]|nr:hypothetical protein [Planctomycetota bacterium]
MNTTNRMSPLTALFFGIFGIGAVAIAGGTAVLLRGLSIVDGQVSNILELAEGTVEGLPAILEGLPPAIGDVLSDRRAPDYTPQIDVAVRFVTDERRAAPRPAVTVKNNGGDIVTLLAIHVTAVNSDQSPVAEWTEVVATPLALEGNWRGPMLPHAERVVLLSPRYDLSAPAAGLVGRVEISDVRIWVAKEPVDRP